MRSSPRSLQLRLYCTYGTPVLKKLKCWPPLPLVVNYGRSLMVDPPTSEDEKNIIAALKQFDRVDSISLTITNSLLKKLSKISEPFSELEELDLLSPDDVQLSCAFRWGPPPRTLCLTRIVILALPKLLSHPTELVDFRRVIPNVGYLYPDEFANALSEMAQLQNLSLSFISRHVASFTPPPNHVVLPPSSGELIALPSLTCLKYQGALKDLDSLVARIDAPRLWDIDITFFSWATMGSSQLGQQTFESLRIPSPLPLPTQTPPYLLKCTHCALAGSQTGSCPPSSKFATKSPHSCSV